MFVFSNFLGLNRTGDFFCFRFLANVPDYGQMESEARHHHYVNNLAEFVRRGIELLSVS
jgi:hypothetical protein